MDNCLISYNDDNHYTQFWFNGDYIGSTEDVLALLEDMYYLGIGAGAYQDVSFKIIEINIDNVKLKDKDFEILHNYLSTPKEIDNRVWKKLYEQDFVNAVNIIRGELL